ncbi:MAG: DUF2130 domain-containing protein [Acidobacteria bacterium]|jgi:hypothetical protein|nr:DUF2130 domain-containing protein [Acidobacteriota bacterium]HNU83963.1 DUF2130 domain-containing protein [Thermoanaerobaculia bacterium]
MTRTLTLPADATISCPRCRAAFPLAEGIAGNVIESYAEAAETERRRLAEELREEAAVEARRQLAREHDRAVAALREELDLARAEAGERERRAAEAAQERTERLAADLAARDAQVAELRARETDLHRQQRELADRAQALELETERRLAAERSQIAERAEAQAAERHLLRLRELEKKLEDAQRANEDLARKLQQGSSQLHGEALELELERQLAEAFPHDRIEGVKKGQRGADVLQEVRLVSGTSCGRIVWEAKNAANWSKGWIDKLKEDQQANQAELAVLVATARPAELGESFGLHQGVWVVPPALALPLAQALRQTLLEAQKHRAVAAGRDDHAAALLDYLTSPQFANRLRGVAEAYQTLQGDLLRERTAMERIWKRREAQLDRVVKNLMGMGGEIEAITRHELPGLAPLALPEGEEPDEGEEPAP